MNRWLSLLARKCASAFHPAFRPASVERLHRPCVGLPPSASTASAAAALPLPAQPYSTLQSVPVRPQRATRPTRPTRILEWECSASGTRRTLGRVVMVGNFSEICAELDRLAALEMA